MFNVESTTNIPIQNFAYKFSVITDDIKMIRSENVQRIRIETADGGVICLDCNLQKTKTDVLGVSFSGILDASGLKSSISRVVRCSVDDGE